MLSARSVIPLTTCASRWHLQTVIRQPPEVRTFATRRSHASSARQDNNSATPPERGRSFDHDDNVSISGSILGQLSDPQESLGYPQSSKKRQRIRLTSASGALSSQLKESELSTTLDGQIETASNQPLQPETPPRAQEELERIPRSQKQAEKAIRQQDEEQSDGREETRRSMTLVSSRKCERGGVRRDILLKAASDRDRAELSADFEPFGDVDQTEVFGESDFRQYTKKRTYGMHRAIPDAIGFATSNPALIESKTRINEREFKRSESSWVRSQAQRYQNLSQKGQREAARAFVSRVLASITESMADERLRRQVKHDAHFQKVIFDFERVFRDTFGSSTGRGDELDDTRKVLAWAANPEPTCPPSQDTARQPGKINTAREAGDAANRTTSMTARGASQHRRGHRQGKPTPAPFTEAPSEATVERDLAKPENDDLNLRYLCSAVTKMQAKILELSAIPRRTTTKKTKGLPRVTDCDSQDPPPIRPVAYGAHQQRQTTPFDVPIQSCNSQTGGSALTALTGSKWESGQHDVEKAANLKNWPSRHLHSGRLPLKISRKPRSVKSNDGFKGASPEIVGQSHSASTSSQQILTNANQEKDSSKSLCPRNGQSPSGRPGVAEPAGPDLTPTSKRAAIAGNDNGAISAEAPVSIYHQLFPEETAQASKKLIAKEKSIPRLAFPQEAMLPQLDPASSNIEPRSRTQIDRREHHWLSLKSASKSLMEEDFRRALPRGKHIPAWTEKAQYERVVPERDFWTLEKTGDYWISFKSKAYADAFLKHIKRIHELSKSQMVTSILSPLPPVLEGDQGFTVGEEREMIRNFSLVPHSQSLLLERKTDGIKVDIMLKGGYPQALPGDLTPETPQVLLELVDGPMPNHNEIAQAIHVDGLRRGLHWGLLSGPLGLRRLQMRRLKPAEVEAKGMQAHEDEQSFSEAELESRRKAEKPRHGQRWVLAFKHPEDAKRFARRWHRSTFPWAEKRTQHEAMVAGITMVRTAELLW